MTDTKQGAPRDFIRRAWVLLILIAGLAVGYALVAPRSEAPQPKPQPDVKAQAAEARKYCGSSGHPSCVCRGIDTVIRDLRPRQSILVRANGNVNFFPGPSPTTFELCDPEDRTRCVSEPDKNLHVGMMFLVHNLSDKTLNIACEYD